MTLGGDHSVSPLVQTSHQLQVNAMSSITPLPLNYYQARPLMLPQGVFECLPPAQIQPFNPYGGDTRGQPGNIVSGVPFQQNFTQGNNYYQQPVSTAMLQQPQQSQAYHINVHPMSNLRHSTASHQPQMMFTSQNVVPTSNVILVPSNMYPTVAPLDPPNTFVQDGATCSNIEYHPNEPPPLFETGIPPIAAPLRPVQLNKKVLSIMDPDTGRDISVELFSTSTEQQDEEIITANQNEKEVCQALSRRTADRLKSPDHFNTSCESPDSCEAGISVSTISAVGVSSNQQYQPPLFKQHEQQQQPSFMPAAITMRPLATGPHIFLQTHPAMPQQTRITAVQPHDTQNEVLAVNLRMSPPPYFLQQPTQLLCNTVWQQHQYPSSHHFPAHTQPFQQQQQKQPINPPGTHPLLPQNSPELQPQHQPPQPVHNQPPNIFGDPVPQSHKVEVSATDEQKPLMGATPPDSMPVETTEPPSTSTSEPTRMSPTLPQTAECADSRPSSVKTKSDEEAIILKSPGDINRKEASLEVISQDMKDGLCAKNNNKDLNSKEIKEFDMGGFIDTSESTQETKSNAIKTTVESNSIGLLGNSARDEDTKTTVIAKYVTQRDGTSSCDIQSDTETSTNRDIKNHSVVMEAESVNAKLLKIDGASGGSGKNNITRTNKTLDVATSAAEPSGAMVPHSGQEVLEAKSIFTASAPENADWNAQRHVPVVESGDTRYDRCSSSDEGAGAQQVAETQKQAATRPQGRASRLERYKLKMGLKTQTKQKINPCSSPSQYSEVQSKVVEANEKLAQLQLAIGRKLLQESAATDNKTSSAPFDLSQELSNMTNVQVHMVTTAQPDEAAKKVVPIMQTETKLNVEASQSPRSPTAINISDPTKHQNQPQTEQTRNTAEISCKAQGQAHRQNSNTLETCLMTGVRGELEPTLSINNVSDSTKADYPVTGEDQTLETVPMPESEDVQKGQAYECSSTAASRTSTQNTKVQNKRLRYDRAVLLKLSECAASQKKPELLGSPDFFMPIILDKPIFSGSYLAPLGSSPTFLLQTDSNAAPDMINP